MRRELSWSQDRLGGRLKYIQCTEFQRTHGRHNCAAVVSRQRSVVHGLSPELMAKLPTSKLEAETAEARFANFHRDRPTPAEPWMLGMHVTSLIQYYSGCVLMLLLAVCFIPGCSLICCRWPLHDIGDVLGGLSAKLWTVWDAS